MNKLVKFGKLGVLTIALGLMATSCKKDEGEFPTKTAAGGYTADFAYEAPTLPTILDADGILAAVDAHNYRIVTLSPFEKQFQYGMAAFTNTTGNFSSLTSGGSVTVDTSALTPNSSMLYQSYPTTYSLNFSGSNIAWSVSGAGTVPAMTYTNTGALPVFTLFSNTAANTSYWKDEWVPEYPVPVNTSADSIANATPFFSMPIKGYVANTDTVIIGWHDDAGFSFFKKFAATDSLALITPNELSGYQVYNQGQNLIMEINLVNYNSTSSGGKKYYFIRQTSYMKYWRTN